jgi:hypothetical protein
MRSASSTVVLLVMALVAACGSAPAPENEPSEMSDPDTSEHDESLLYDDEPRPYLRLDVRRAGSSRTTGPR